MGNIVAMVLFFTMIFISFLVGDNDDVTISTKAAASLSSHTGYSYAL